MSYNITLTDGNLLAVIPNGTTNSNVAPPLVLIGQNYAGGYGEFQNDNFVRLLESGANTTAPVNPLVGQLWYNTTTRTLQVYNGTNFKPISGATASPTAPTINSTGDLWYDTVNQQLNVWTGSAWLIVGPTTNTGTGAIPAILLDAANVQHSVVELVVDGNIVGIVSESSSFTPSPTLSGFTQVYPGITLSTSVNGETPTFVGTATNATTVDNLSPSVFMRTNANTGTTGTVTVLNGAGILIGNNNEFTANVVANSTVNLYNHALNGNINIGINKGGTATTAIRVDGSSGNVAIAGNLSVAGNVTVTNTEIIDANEVVTGNLIAGQITSNTTVTSNLFIGNGAPLTSITGANVTGIVANANVATFAQQVKAANWTILQSGSKLIFQFNGSNIASLTSTGDFVTIGNVTAFGTP